MSAGSRSATGSQIRGSSVLFAGQVFAVLVNLVLQVLIVRYLSQESYGAFAYALSVMVLAQTVAAFGMRRGVARYMPLYEEGGDLARAAGTLVLAIGTVLTLGLAVFLVVTGLRGVIAGSFADDPTAVTVLVLLVALAPIEALGMLLDGVFAVFARPLAIVVRRFVLTPLFRLTVVALLVLQGQGVIFLAAGYLVTGVLGLGLYGPLLVRTLREHDLIGWLRPGRFSLPVREVFGFTVPLQSTDLKTAMLGSGSGVLLGVLATPIAVAEFRAVLPLVLTMGYVLQSFGLLLVPFASRLYARSESGELNRLYWRTAVWTAALAYPIFLTCVVLAEPLTVLLFGERYANAAPVLAVLSVGYFFNTALGHNGTVLAVFGRVRYIVFTNAAAVVLSFSLLLLLVPPYAAVGAAVATATSLVVVNVIRQFGLARRTDVQGIARGALPSYGAMSVATVGALATQLILSPPTVASIALVVAAVIAVFAAARSGLALGETFPELARVPVVRQLVGAEVDR